MSAVTQVFSIAELVEHILLQDLSVIELVRAQRISHFVKDVISNSVKLRRVLFLDPAAVSETYPYRNGTDDDEIAFEKTTMQAHAVTKIHPFLTPESNLYHHDPTAFRIDTKTKRAELGNLRSNLVCQPPPKQLCVRHLPVMSKEEHSFGSGRFYASQRAYATVKNNTLGALFETLETLESEGAKIYGMVMRDGLYEGSEDVARLRRKADLQRRLAKARARKRALENEMKELEIEDKRLEKEAKQIENEAKQVEDEAKQPDKDKGGVMTAVENEVAIADLVSEQDEFTGAADEDETEQEPRVDGN